MRGGEGGNGRKGEGGEGERRGEEGCPVFLLSRPGNPGLFVCLSVSVTVSL